MWELELRTPAADGDPVAFATEATDTYAIEFRRPSGNWVPRAATYADGTMTYDQAGDTTLLDEPGGWEYRAVITRRGGGTIKSPSSRAFWVAR